MEWQEYNNSSSWVCYCILSGVTEKWQLIMTIDAKDHRPYNRVDQLKPLNPVALS
jgi:hypothetical protein